MLSPSPAEGTGVLEGKYAVSCLYFPKRRGIVLASACDHYWTLPGGLLLG